MKKGLQKSSVLAVLIAVFLAFSIAGFAVLFSDNLTAAAEEEKAPAVTVYLGDGGKNDTANKVYQYKDFIYGWSKVVDYAKEVYAENPTDYVKVILQGDWVAEKDSAQGFNNGLSGDYYTGGRIYVPKGTNITIDLCGHTINRNLTKGITNGQLFYIDGSLTVNDSVGGGKLTGAYNSTTSTGYGCIYISSGSSFTLNGGSIEGNKVEATNVMGTVVSNAGGKFVMNGGAITNSFASVSSSTAACSVYGGAVWVYNGGTFDMNGGTISGNRSYAENHSPASLTASKRSASVYGGGVCVYSGGLFNMYGGTISDNSGTVISENGATYIYGGGVAGFNNASNYINIDGGTIKNNSATHGGGVAVYSQGKLDINSGDICGNTATLYGGGVYCLAGGTASVPQVTINGGNIRHNAVVNNSSTTFGGGVALMGNTAGCKAEATITGGTVDGNVAIGPSTTAGGISLGGKGTAELTLEGGLFINNRSFGLNAEALKENTEKDGAILQSVVNAYLSGNKDEIEKVQGYLTEADSIGGAFHVGKTATLIMNGGTVGREGEPNRSEQGGGVYVGGGTFIITGGSITHNLAHGGAGVRVASDGDVDPSITISGNPVVKDNKLYGINGDNGWDAEKFNGKPHDFLIHDATNHRATIGALTEGEAEIHIVVDENMVVNGGAFTKNYSKDGNGTLTNSKEVTVAGTGEKLTVYANPYNYFSSDLTYPYKGINFGNLTDQHIVVFTGGAYEGELGVYPGRVAFVVEYSDGTKEQYIFGEKFVKDEEKGIFYPAYNYIECDYGASRKPTKITAYKIDADGQIQDVYEDSKKLGEAKEIKGKGSQVYEAGIYTLQVRVNNEKDSNGKDLEPAYMAFSILVQSKPFTDDDVTTGGEGGDNGLQISISGDTGLHYNPGTKHEPAVDTIKFNGLTLVAWNKDSGTGDYKVTYENNEEAGVGTAYVVIEFVNNYSGTIRIPFTIEPSESTAVTTNVEWQILSGSSWVALTSGNSSLIYDKGADLSGLIRAKLTYSNAVSGDYQTVYSKGYIATGDEEQNTAMWLEYKLNGEAVEFGQIGEYEIKIIGNANYQFTAGHDTYNGFKITTLQLTLSADDFSNYSDGPDGTGDRLWRLQIGTGDSVLYSTLLDEIIYTLNGQEEAQHGKEADSFARFRNTGLSLVLNGNYTIGEKDLSYYLGMATVDYYTDEGTEATTLNGMVVGENGVLVTVTTKVVLTFDSNYAVSGGNEITLTKTWYIVTVSNNLLTEEGDNTDKYEDGKLSDLVFGFDSVAHVFRPEHGNVLVYTYYKDGEPAGQFALVYVPLTGNPFYADKTFFGVTTVNGEWAVDYDNPIEDDSYLYTFNAHLKAGDYTLIVTIPQCEPSTEQHTHWWNGETANDNGTMYYKVEHTFTFTVKTYSLINEGDEINEGIQVVFPEDGFVYYTGVAGNVVEPTITLNGITLVRGVDYELSSTSIDATNGLKEARLIITGINSLTGTYIYNNAFEIRKAFNGWTAVPSIMRWTYFGYDSEIHVLTGAANFGEVWYSIADENGNVIEGLDNIHLENGLVSVDVAKLLKGLNAGKYNLIAHVTETDNYAGLAPDAITFQVFQANNIWESKSVNKWIQGEYESPDKNLLVHATFGDVHIVIEGADGKVYYDNEKGIDNLINAKAGTYKLRATVIGTSNYTELDTGIIEFEIFKKPGLPWWATMLIAIGALAVAALIIFILWKKGVFQILTEKLFVAIKTRASVEATIASVRAAKMMEEGRQSVAEAKRRERIELMRQRAKEERELSPEERAAKIEAKAQADAARAEKLRLRSEAAQKRAEKMRNHGEADTSASDNNPQTPTEE